MVGARRTDGACGTNPRRVEATQGEIGGTLRFSQNRTATHSLGRGLFFEAGTFAGRPEGTIFWYGDDHSRLVALDTALPLAGGRVSTGNWAEYAFGASFLPNGAVLPILPFPAATIRSVDIGLCSSAQAWTSPNGCGTADTMMRQIEALDTTQAFRIPDYIPGLGFCVNTSVSAAARPGTARWAVEMGTVDATPLRSQDRFCVEFGLDLRTALDCVGFIPQRLGCQYDEWTVRACGEFGTRLVDDVHRDPIFTIRSFESNPGPGTGHDTRLCAFPADLTLVRDIVETQIRDTLVGGINAGLRGATVRRELETSAPMMTPGTCSAPITTALRSNCARPQNGWTPNQDCAEFVTGDPDSTSVRTSCEIRGSGAACATDADCAVVGALRRCEIQGRCASDGLGNPSCTTDADCQSGRCIVTRSECIDRQPVCYWNVEVDRVETLPSGLQVVIAEDEADETFQAFSALSALPFLQEDGICRPPVPPPFEGGSAIGVLGPASGAPIP